MNQNIQINPWESPERTKEKLLSLRNHIDSLLETISQEEPARAVPLSERIKALEMQFASLRKEQTSHVDVYKQSFFNMLADLPQSIIGIVDSDFRILYIEGKGLEAAQLNPESLIGQIMPDLNPSPSERSILIKALQRTLEGASQNFKISYTDRYYQMHTVLLQDSATDEQRIMFITWDISPERLGNIKLQTALDASGVIVAEYDFQKEQFKPNQALYDLVGWPDNEAMSMDDFRSHYHEEDRKRREAEVKLTGNKGPLNYDARIYTPQGMKWIRVVGSVITDINGDPQTGFAAILDITQDKVLIEKARLSEERFRLIADSAPVMIWMSNADKDSIYLNPMWLDFTGRSMEEDTGDGWAEHLHPEDREEFIQYRDQAFIDKESFIAELRFRRKDGEYRWLLNNGVPIFDGEGIFRGFIGSCVDITEQKEATEALEKRVAQRTRELARANKELTDLNIHLEEYAHAASHDLQEPLRKIEMFLSLVKSGPADSEKTTRYLTKIEETAQRMRALVKDILSFSTLGNSRPEFTDVNLDLVLEDLIDDFELLIKESETKIEKDNLGHIQGDRSKLHQLFSNLIKNAITYNEGSPHIELRTGACTGGKNGCEHLPLRQGKPYKWFTIKDNGIGFEQEQVQEILKPFQRLHSKGKYPGTGLGLSIVSRIVDIHHGHLEVLSTKDKGSEFRVYLPVDPIPEAYE